MIARVQVIALIVVSLASMAVSLWLVGEPLSWTWVDFVRRHCKRDSLRDGVFRPMGVEATVVAGLVREATDFGR